MADDADPNDGVPVEGEDPAAAAGDDGEPVDLEALAKEYEEQVAAGLGIKDADDKGGDDKGEGQGRKAAGSSVAERLSAFIDKNYNGDAEAFFAAQYAQREEGKRMAERVRELEAKVTAAPVTAQDREAALKAARDASAEVQSLNHEIKDIDDETKAIGQRQIEIGAQAGKINDEMQQLRGQLIKADVDERSDINLKILNLEQKLSSLNTEWSANENSIRSNSRQRRILAMELRKADAAIKEEMSERERGQAAAATVANRTRAAFITAMVAQTKDYGLDVTVDSDGKPVFKDASARVLYHSVRTQLAEWLDDQGEDADSLSPAEIADAVRALLTAHAEAGFIKKKAAAPKPGTKGAPRPVVFKGATPPRMPLARPNGEGRDEGGEGGEGDDNRPRSLKEMEGDADYWRRRAEYLDTRGNRTGVLRRRLS